LNDGIGRAGFSVEYVSVFIEKEESSVPVEWQHSNEQGNNSGSYITCFM
jgi:hypothetical protein